MIEAEPTDSISDAERLLAAKEEVETVDEIIKESILAYRITRKSLDDHYNNLPESVPELDIFAEKTAAFLRISDKLGQRYETFQSTNPTNANEGGVKACVDYLAQEAINEIVEAAFDLMKQRFPMSTLAAHPLVRKF